VIPALAGVFAIGLWGAARRAHWVAALAMGSMLWLGIVGWVAG
jgi:hypothetical protein